jgi:hypothetical protein
VLDPDTDDRVLQRWLTESEKRSHLLVNGIEDHAVFMLDLGVWSRDVV